MNANDQEFLARKIRSEYTEKEGGAADELKALDKKVKRPANIFGYDFGSIGAIVMGAGMSLVMTDLGATLGIESTMTVGVIVGAVGLVMTVINYPIFKSILGARKKKFAGEIIELSDKIIKG